MAILWVLCTLLTTQGTSVRHHVFSARVIRFANIISIQVCLWYIIYLCCMFEKSASRLWKSQINNTIISLTSLYMRLTGIFQIVHITWCKMCYGTVVSVIDCTKGIQESRQFIYNDVTFVFKWRLHRRYELMCYVLCKVLLYQCYKITKNHKTLYIY